ncbi:hypothetical protein C8R43DRAFT_335579 [Mycena crocata]|nr:hypothetical protein C8R43DRAFT_335579 [Mycena crocata]
MDIPALPKIEGDVDIILDIYTHHSLKGNNTMNSEYGDTERLVELGRKVLDMTLVVHLFHKHPLLVAEEISSQSKTAVSDVNLREWLTAYDTKTKFRAAPGACDILESPEDMRKFFHAYIGALYIRNGINQVQAWVSALVDPEADVNSFATPPPPVGMPPPLPQNTSSPQPNTGLSLLALLNQTATQNRLSVTYPAEQTGPPHAPTWSVRCQINNIDKGRGTGKSQKLAKEEAARQAMKAMGWQ